MKPTISIGIPAYNEAENIQNLLRCILSQDMSLYTLEEIYVISDGSTDRTVEEASSIADSRIKVTDVKERIGKSEHLNSFFAIANDSNAACNKPSRIHFSPTLFNSSLF